jgi:hypothetical protein
LKQFSKKKSLFLVLRGKNRLINLDIIVSVSITQPVGTLDIYKEQSSNPGTLIFTLKGEILIIRSIKKNKLCIFVKFVMFGNHFSICFTLRNDSLVMKFIIYRTYFRVLLIRW